MVRTAQRLIAAKGKRVTTLELQKEPPADDAIAALMLGPTGNLRAPTIRVGQTVLIGYNETAFAQVFGS